MKNQEIKFKSKNHNYSIIIGKNSINILPRKIKSLCPKSKKIALIFDKNVPIKFKIDLNLRPQNLNFETYYKLTQEYENLTC